MATGVPVEVMKVETCYWTVFLHGKDSIKSDVCHSCAIGVVPLVHSASSEIKI